MRQVGGIVCAIGALPFALITVLLAAGSADPDADSDAWVLLVATLFTLAATTALLGVVAATLRASGRLHGWCAASPTTYWLVVLLSLAAPATEVATAALDELTLDALYLAGSLGLVVGLTVLMIERTAWGAVAAAAMMLALAAVSLSGA